MMNDEEVLGEVRRSLTAACDVVGHVHPPYGPEEIRRRAGARRARRITTGGTALGLGVALAIGLGAGLPSGGHSTPSAASTGKGVHIAMAGWSVDTESNGTVKLSLSAFTHPDELRSALAKAGVNAVLEDGQDCIFDPKDYKTLMAIVPEHPMVKNGVAMEIVPAAIPHGTRLVLGFRVWRTTPAEQAAGAEKLGGTVTNALRFSVALTRPGAPVSCTPTP